MENQYYYKLMASYLSKRNCDESFMRYFFGKNAAKKTPEELERADERKRRLQRERSRRYRALKNARRHGGSEGSEAEARARRAAPAMDDELSDCDEPPTLCDLSLMDDKWRDASDASDDAAPPSPATAKLPPTTDFAITLKEFLSSPNAELEPSTVHTLMFHWLQT